MGDLDCMYCGEQMEFLAGCSAHPHNLICKNKNCRKNQELSKIKSWSEITKDETRATLKADGWDDSRIERFFIDVDHAERAKKKECVKSINIMTMQIDQYKAMLKEANRRADFLDSEVKRLQQAIDVTRDFVSQIKSHQS